MAKPGNKARNKQAVNSAEDAALELHENLEEFEDFQKTVLPVFRKAIQGVAKGEKTPQQVWEQVKAAAAARQVNIALLEQNSSVALKAIESILNRTEGPVTQKHEVSHLEKMSDEQLEAQILTRMNKMKDDSEEESDVH